jgi:RNA polymerase sigma factor (sigma-70 family)
MENNSEIISAYMKSIRHIPLLTRDEERDYSKRMLDGKKKIVSTIKSKASLKRVVVLLEKNTENSTVDEDERNELIAIMGNCTLKDVDNIQKIFLTIDFDILKKYAESNKRLHKTIAEVIQCREMLVKSNLRLVISIAKQFSNRGMSFLDLIQEGNIGLIKAVDKYDVSRGSKLGTVATWWIRQAIIRSVQNKSRMIRVPVHMIDSMNRAYRRLTEDGIEPTPELMKKELGMPNLSLYSIKEVMGIMSGTVSLSDPIGDDENGNEATLEVFLEDPNPTCERGFINADLKAAISSELRLLSPREEKVIRLRLGI